MVQQAASRNLRLRRAGSDGQKPTGEDVSTTYDAFVESVEATIDAGLRPKVLTKPELLRFKSNTNEYLDARNHILVQWYKDQMRFLTLEECISTAPPGGVSQKAVKAAYAFLHQQGYINIGILKGDPLVPVPPDFGLPSTDINKKKGEEDGDGDDDGDKDNNGEGGGKGKQDPIAGNEKEAVNNKPPPQVTDNAIEEKLYEILKDADLETTTEKHLRAELGEYFQQDMKPHKGIIREYVTAYLEGGGPPKSYKDRKKREAKEAERAARREEMANIPITRGRVVVIGAGPAGLSAALHLKRNNVDVVVLEARSRVGGRVNSHSAPGFSTPIDLGASIITGTKADSRKSLRPDPSALLCRQLGIELHPLESEALPLFDITTGKPVDPALDKEVEMLRDQVMDDAAEELEEVMELPEAETKSYGEMLTRALDRHLAKTGEGVLVVEENDKKKEAVHGDGGDNGQHAVDTAPTTTNPAAAAAAVVTVEVEGEKTTTTATAVAVVEIAAPVDNTETDNPASSQPPPPSTTQTTNQEEEEEEEDDEDKPRPLPEVITKDHLRLLHWHWANLEYGCSAPLSEISGLHWNQDEDFGGFGGPHCMVVGGYTQPFTKLSQLLDVKLNTAVKKIRDDNTGVTVITADGQALRADAVVVTVPLGVLKAGAIEFTPALPAWKQEAIEKLGFGDLNKLVLQFDHVFWDDSVDFFGVTPPGDDSTTEENRGECFMFWNLHRFSKAPILAALISGKAARAFEGASPKRFTEKAMVALRSVHPDKTIPDPIAITTSQWASEEYSKGSYSFIAVQGSAKEYDQLALPVRRRVLFAGEHTVKEHPDTVGGAMLSGFREASRAIELLIESGTEAAANVRAAMVAAEAKGAVLHSAQKKRKHYDATDGFDSEDNNDDDDEAEDRSRSGKSSKRGRSDHDDEDEDKGERLERRMNQVMGVDVARRAEEFKAREAVRHDMKLMARALMEASATGKATHVGEQLIAAETSTEKDALLSALRMADASACKAIACHQPAIVALAKILEESSSGGGQQHGHLASTLGEGVLLVLKQLFPASPPPFPIKLSGVNMTLELLIRKSTRHSDPAVSKAAIALVKCWKITAPVNNGGGGVDKMKNQDGGNKRPKVEVTRLPTALPNVKEKVNNDDDDDDDDDDVFMGEADPQKGQLLLPAPTAAINDAIKQQELQDAEARLKELEEELASQAQQAAAYESQAAGRGEGQFETKLTSFDAFKESMRRKAKPKLERKRTEAESYGGSDDATATATATATGGTATAGAGVGGIFDPITRKKIKEYIAAVLQKSYNERKISKPEYKAAMHRTLNVVYEKGQMKAGEEFLNAEEKGKISNLIKQIVMKMRSQ
jgi:monoamine oxidase